MQITLIAESLDFVILDSKLCNTQKDSVQGCVYTNVADSRVTLNLQYIFCTIVRRQGLCNIFFAQAVRQEGYTVCERWDWKILTLGSASPYPRAERKTFQCTSFQKVLGPSTKSSTKSTYFRKV